MSRAPGAGRKKGTPNKKTVELMTMLEGLKFDPGQELVFCYREAVKLYQERKKAGYIKGAVSSLSLASKVANDIAQFVYPRKKAIEHSGEVGVKTFADFVAAAEDDEE